MKNRVHVRLMGVGGGGSVNGFSAMSSLNRLVKTVVPRTKLQFSGK